LALYPQLGDRLGEANVQKALGDLALREDDLAGARPRYEAALALYPQLGDRLGEANVQKALGDLALREGNRELAVTLLQKAIGQYRRISDRLGEATALNVLGKATDNPEYFEQAILLHTQIQSVYGVAVDSYYFGLSQNKLGNHKKAHELLTRAGELWRSIGLEVYAQMAEKQRAGE
jgi:tetratricopeptide (TPR) repeat protein